MGGRRRPVYYAKTFTELDNVEPRPATNAITEADLIRGYSGLVDQRPTFVTAETVRSRLAAAYGTAAVDGAPSREDAGSPDVVVRTVDRR